MHSAAYAGVRCLPSVYLSHSCIYSQTFSPCGSPTTLFSILSAPNVMALFQREPPECGRWMHVGYEKLRLSTNLSLYLGNDIRYGHRYNGVLCNLSNSVISNNRDWPLSLQDGTRQSYTYDCRSIGSRLWSIKWWYTVFSMTVNEP